MKDVPTPLAILNVPEYFSPSQISLGDECLLRIGLASGREVPRLNSHPSAEIGRLFHRLLERAVHGDIERRGELHDDLRRTLSDMLQEAQERLGSDSETEAYADLTFVVTPLAWRKKARTAVDVAAQFYLLRPNRSEIPSEESGRALEFSRLPAEGKWTEVSIVAPSLRVRGRMDVVEKAGGRTTIRDLKSGRVLDTDGQMYPHIERQLRVYGVMAGEADPDTEVRLVVDDGTEHTIPFEMASVNEIKAWIRAVTARLPLGSALEPRELANPGEWCARCASRVACPTYREAAPRLWNSEAGFQLPLDSWGVVSKITNRDALTDIVMKDAAQRRVKLFGIRSALLRGLAVGDELWCFGLRAQLRPAANGKWQHPLNFYEVTDTGRYDRAWSLEVFRGEPAQD